MIDLLGSDAHGTQGQFTRDPLTGALVPVVVGMGRQAGREKPDPYGLTLALADLGVLGRASCMVEVGAGNGELSLHPQDKKICQGAPSGRAACLPRGPQAEVWLCLQGSRRSWR